MTPTLSPLELLEACKYRALQHFPFFGYLLLHTPYEVHDHIPTACTDGKKMMFGTHFMQSIQPNELIGLIAHELLHIVFLHISRRKEREAQLWNIACDLTINHLVLESGIPLPVGGIVHPNLFKKSAEAIYEELLNAHQNGTAFQLFSITDQAGMYDADWTQLLKKSKIQYPVLDAYGIQKIIVEPHSAQNAQKSENSDNSESKTGDSGSKSTENTAQSEPNGNEKSLSDASKQKGQSVLQQTEMQGNAPKKMTLDELGQSISDMQDSSSKENQESGGEKTANTAPSEADGISIEDIQSLLERARIHADTLERRKQFGKSPSIAHRELQAIQNTQVNWKTELIHYLSAYPNDFSGFDRRLIHAGLYLEELVGEKLEIAVCIDTSGSIRVDLLNQFYSELKGICRQFEHIKIDLWFCDTHLSKKMQIEQEADFSKVKAKGGGGTDFTPFFKYIQKQTDVEYKVLLYFTDGFGQFPAKAPRMDTIWLLSPDSCEHSNIPFGKVIQLY